MSPKAIECRLNQIDREYEKVFMLAARYEGMPADTLSAVFRPDNPHGRKLERLLRESEELTRAYNRRAA